MMTTRERQHEVPNLYLSPLPLTGSSGSLAGSTWEDSPRQAKDEALQTDAQQLFPESHTLSQGRQPSEEARQVTHFPHPSPALAAISNQVIRYQRPDGVELSAVLHLPAGYDPATSGPLPTLMWAYPREFKTATGASQNKRSPHSFAGTLSPTSPVYMVLAGYAVVTDFAMPVVGEGKSQPNDTFLDQIRANALAAAEKLQSIGVADHRIAVAGHSYGGFMTANLLAHNDYPAGNGKERPLFVAGIARSGAFNRTLTPFGFQGEQRTFWEAPETYHKMSPLERANRIEAPLLLIAGEEDTNVGTWPGQSRRFFQAIQGNGGTSRLVMLPHEVCSPN